MKTAYQFPTYVKCPKCGTKADEEKVRFVDIAEDVFGRDVVTYICPKCGDMVKSNRYN
ncbi:MAG: hypothetical protein WC196_06315 [Bacilli bacterium]|jgi:endogenous inhibitor of DNA gyrase (YacG/DUF329 family)